MPLPEKSKKEDRNDFMSRCMSSDKMKEEFPDGEQRTAVCLKQSGATAMEAADYIYHMETFGYTEDITENNFYIPTQEEYVDFDEQTEEWDVSIAKPGLWENIRKKKEREGKNYRPAKPGDPDRPTQDQIKRAQSEAEAYGVPPKESDGLQYGRPKKNDPRKTPAPKKDQKRGSKKNKPDSAKNPSGKITFSKKVIDQLKNKVSEHNAKKKGSKATLGQLKAVYRRGAGAYSTSHAPKMSRHGWAIARVNAFLYLLRNGRPSNPNYKQDNDLLPKGHPRKSKAKNYTINHPDGTLNAGFKYKDIKTGEIYEFVRQGVYKKDGRTLVPILASEAAEYQGRKVTLNKPFRTPDGPKKFAVYTKNQSGNVVIVRFGDPNMEIKRDNPERRKSFRARHKCDTNPGPKWKARYWSCRMW